MAQKPDVLLPEAQELNRFDENNEKYRCCCGGKCHSRTGTLIIGGIGLFFAVSAIIVEAIGFALSPGGFSGTTYGGFMVGAIAIVVYSLLIHGVRKEQRVLLIPHMVFQIFAIIGLAIGIVLLFLTLIGVSITGVVKTEEDRQAVAVDYRAAAAVSALLMILLLVILLLQIWLFIVVFKFFRYLRDKGLVFLPTNVENCLFCCCCPMQRLLTV